MSPSSHASPSTPLLSDRVYTILKHSAAIGLPALAALYFALAQIWNFPDTKEVMATIAAVNTFVGSIVTLSNAQYHKSDAKYVGEIAIADNGTKKTYSINLNSEDPEDLDTMSEATFKITPVVSVQSPSQSGT